MAHCFWRISRIPFGRMCPNVSGLLRRRKPRGISGIDLLNCCFSPLMLVRVANLLGGNGQTDFRVIRMMRKTHVPKAQNLRTILSACEVYSGQTCHIIGKFSEDKLNSPPHKCYFPAHNTIHKYAEKHQCTVANRSHVCSWEAIYLTSPQ